MIPEYSFHSREMALPEPTPDARAHGNRILPRLNVQIAGAELNRILNQAVDQDRHLEVLSGHFGF